MSDFLKKNIITVISFILSLIIISYPVEHSRVIFLDVGQGDAILIQDDDFEILIDGGEDDDILFKLPMYMKPGDMKVDIMILTHPHADHIVGFLNVLENYDVGEIWIYPSVYESSLYENLLTNYKDDIKYVYAGDSFEKESINMQIIWPVEGYQDSNINNESIVIYLNLENTDFLLMGDAEQEIEKILIEKYNLSDIEILKAGHHCSRTASSESFLLETTPEISICSCGLENKFKHPHKETVYRLENIGSDIVYTFEEGDYVVGDKSLFLW